MRIRWIVTGLVSLLLAGAAAWIAATGWYTPYLGWAKPWWLLLAALLPPLAVMAWPALGNLGQTRRVLVLGLRLGVFASLILALAELSTVREEEGMTLLILVDRSFSIPQEMAAGSVRDARWDRLVEAVKKATRERSRGQDRVGVISFAAKPRLEYPVTDIPELNLREVGASLDRNLTDIGAAIRLGLASFPEGTARRILLISDGNENRGDAEGEARTAKYNGVPIDVVPLKYKYDDEILVDRLDVPSESRPGQDIPLRIVARNYAGRAIAGKLRITRQMGSKVEQAEERHTLEPGLNVISARWPARFGPADERVINYKANFFPDRLPGNRMDNDEAAAPVMLVKTGRDILLIVQDPSKAGHQPLVKALTERPSSKGQRKVTVWPADALPGDDDQGRMQLSNYDTIILFNLPSEAVPRTQQEALRKTVRDQGTGLVMIGGPVSFGAGGWQNEPLEEAMPIDSALRSRKVQAKGGLALVMHASEMEEGNYWQKEIAKLAISKLGPHDEVGILYYTYGTIGGNNGHVWHVPLQEVGEDKNRASILNALGSMQPGDMPQFDPSLTMARDSLIEEKRGISTKHVILISDGDHGLLSDNTILDTYKKNRVTLTTIGITTHGPAAQAALARISKATGGRHYAVDDPKKLPGIYIKETRVLNQSHIYEKPFSPRLTSEQGDPLREWNKAFPRLHGFVRTSRKESNLVQVLMQAPLAGEDENPILAQWQYGLGRSVAFTSDAMGDAGSWSREWVESNPGLYGDFWTRLVDWSMRNLDESGISMQSRYENGKMRVTLIDNRDREQRAAKPLGTLKATIGSSSTSDSKEITLEPVAAGVYEGSVETAQAGNYSVAASMVVKDPKGPGGLQTQIVSRGALSVPYSPEFATVEDNEGVLQRIAEISGGRVLDEKTLGAENLFLHEGAYARRLQPMWHWLLFLAAILLVTDAAIRRIAVDPMAAVRQGRRVVEQMRGQKELTETSQEYLGRLRKGKAAAAVPQVEVAATTVASRRFEAPTDFTALPETTTAAGSKPAAAPQPKPAAVEADDFGARLLKAKQKAREQMEGQKEE